MLIAAINIIILGPQKSAATLLLPWCSSMLSLMYAWKLNGKRRQTLK